MRRDFSPLYASLTLNSTVVDWTLSAPDFWHFDFYMQWSVTSSKNLGIQVHGGGHFSVGGLVGEVSLGRLIQLKAAEKLIHHRCLTCTHPPETPCSGCITPIWIGSGMYGNNLVRLNLLRLGTPPNTN
jgi:hypothetical protein